MKTTFLEIRRFMSRHSLFMMFLRSYILIVAILLIFSILTYFIAIDRISDSVRQLNTAVLASISANLDQQFLENRDMAYRLTNLGSTLKLSYMDKASVDYYPEMTRFVKNLWALWLENDPLTPRMYIYFAREGIVASPATFYNYEDFYTNFFTYNELAPDEFSELILRPTSHGRYLPAAPVFLGDEAGLQGVSEMVLYVYHLKSQSSADDPPGAIFFVINTSVIREMLRNVKAGEGGVAAVIDGEGRIVALLDNRSGLDNEQIRSIAKGERPDLTGRMLVSSVSDHNGWTYLALGNPNVVMEPVAALRRILVILFILSLIGGVAMAFSMARKRSLPLFNLACRLSPDGFAVKGQEAAAARGYQALERGVDQILQTNLSMRERFQKINPALHTAFMYQLFHGGFARDDEIRASSEQYDIRIPAPPYCLVSFRLQPTGGRTDEPRENVLRSLAAQDAVAECLGYMTDEQALVYKSGLDEAYWIYGMSGRDGEAGLLDLLDKIVGWFGEHQIAVMIRYSKQFAELSNSWWIYAQLRQAGSGFSPQAGSSSIAYAWQDQDPAGSRYLLLVGPILASMVRSGDERMLARLLDVVKDEIFDDSQVDPEARMPLVLRIRDLAAQLSGRQIPDQGGDMASMLRQIRETLLQSVAEANKTRKDSGSFLMRKILEFTDSQIDNPELFMPMIADAVNISENYLSRFFREQHGDTLANYIEGKRIRKAQDLLLETVMSVSEIAGRVGYHSDHVFRRAFRRVTGMSPNEYRERNGA